MAGYWLDGLWAGLSTRRPRSGRPIGEPSRRSGRRAIGGGRRARAALLFRENASESEKENAKEPARGSERERKGVYLSL